jgi:ABC-type phosphate transport system substrate-binding protein
MQRKSNVQHWKKKVKKSLHPWILGCGILLGPLFHVSAAEIIVNASVPAARYSRADARAIFAMHLRIWPNGEPIKVFTLADDDRVHKDFVKNNLNMFPHQFRRAWDRMTYTGTGIAPIQLDSEQEMIEKVMNTPNAIGYVSKKPDHAKIRLFDYQ